jgi:hypothetical protein
MKYLWLLLLACSLASAQVVPPSGPGSVTTTNTATLTNKTASCSENIFTPCQGIYATDPAYGAVGDMIQPTNSTQYSISSGSNALSAGTSVFTSSMVGKTIVLPGAGSSGAALITIISGYTSGTAVTLATNAGTALVATAEAVWIGTDNTTAINAAITAVKATLNAVTNASNYKAALYFPGGAYLTTGGVNLTSIQGTETLQIFGNGATIYSANTGNAAVDAIASRYLQWDGLWIVGNCSAEPTTLLQIGRNNTTGNISADNHKFENVTLRGCSSVANFYNMNAEQTSRIHWHNFNSDASGYASILDGVNHFGLTSQFVSMASLPANTQQSFDSNTCIDCIESGNGIAPLWISGATDLQYIGSYAVNGYGSTPNYCGELYTIPGGSQRQYHLDIHCEPAITNAWLITGTESTPIFLGLDYKDGGVFSSSSLLKIDTSSSVTAVNIFNLNLDTPNVASGLSPTVVDTPADYVVTGYANVVNSSWWNLTSFTGIWCEPTAGCRNSLPVSSGSVVGISFTNPPWNYYVQTTQYTPTITIAAPPSGTTATATISGYIAEGIGSLGSGGTGYTSGDTCEVTDAYSQELITITITASAGVIGSYVYGGSTFTVLLMPYALAITNCTHGGGSGGTLESNSVPMRPVNFTITNSGSGYNTAPMVTYSTTHQSGTPIITAILGQPQVSLTNGVTGTLPVGSGGTNQTSNGINLEMLQTNGSGSTAWASVRSMLGGGTGQSAVTANETEYCAPTAISTCGAISGREMFSPISGTFKNLYVGVSGAAGTGQSWIVTMYINGATTALTCTISGSSATTCSDSADSATITAGENFSIQIVASASASDSSIYFGYEFDNP